MSNRRVFGPRPEKSIAARLLPRVRHIQIAGVPHRNEPGPELALDEVFALLLANGYAGWIGCEYRPATTTEDGLSWLHHYPVLQPSPFRANS